MQIKQIHLINFGIHKDLFIDFSPITIIRGKNLHGKTTIADAIEWVLAGWTWKMKKIDDRIGEWEIVNDGSDRGAEVVLNIDKHEIIKKRTRGGVFLTIDERPSRQEDVWKLFGVDGFQMRAALNSGFFLNQDSSARKKILFDLLGGESNQKTIRKMLGERGIENEYIEKIVGLIVERGYAKAQTYAIEQRREAKRKLSVIPQSQPQNEKIIYHEKEVFLSEISLDAILEDLEKANNKRDTIIKQIGFLGGYTKTKIEEKEKEIGRLLKRSESIRTVIATLDAQLLGLGFNDKHFKKLSSEIEKATSKYNIIQNELNILMGRLVELKNKKICPLCHGTINSVEIQQRLNLKINILKKNKDSIHLSDILSKFEDMKKLGIKYDEIKSQISNLLLEKSKLDKNIKIIQNDILDITRKTVDVEKLAVLEEEKQKTEHAISRSNESRAKFENYCSLMKCWMDGQNQKREIDKEINQWDKLEKALSPGGIQKEILSGVVKSFRQRLDKTTNNTLFGRVTFDEDLNFFVNGKPECRFHPMGSELLRLNYYIQEAIAYVSRLKIWILDRVDCLDEDNRELLFDFIQKIKNDYDNIILILTSIETDQKKIDGIGFVNL